MNMETGLTEAKDFRKVEWSVEQGWDGDSEAEVCIARFI